MELTDTAKAAVAGGTTLLTVVAVFGNAVRSMRREEPAGTPAKAETTSLTEPAPPHTPPTVRSKPRILTGEPAPPEHRRSAPRRTLKLVGGITLLAAAGAFFLLALVQTLVAMFKRIG